jgi:hypothetical protein
MIRMSEEKLYEAVAHARAVLKKEWLKKKKSRDYVLNAYNAHMHEAIDGKREDQTFHAYQANSIKQAFPMFFGGE